MYKTAYTLLCLSRCKPLFDLYAFYDLQWKIKSIQSRIAIFNNTDTQYQSFIKNVMLFRPLDGFEFFW